VALNLALVTPGLGQVYNGQLTKGMIVYASFLALVVAYTSTRIAMSFAGFVLVASLGICISASQTADAILTARRVGVVPLRRYNKWYFYLSAALVHFLVVLPLTLVHIPVKAYRAAGISMYPTLRIGDHFMIDRTAYERGGPERGDVVLFAAPGDSLVTTARVIGLPGETLDLQFPSAKFQVPGDRYFLMGDFRPFTYDSRRDGCVPLSSIGGEVLYIYWSRHTDRIGMRVKSGEFERR
jgi:signal peptidase I